MATLIITGIPPYDGEYPLNIDKFKNGELKRIKQISGVTAGKIQAAVNDGDNDLVVAITAVVLERHGFTVVDKVLWDADADCIDFRKDPDDKEEEQLPPASPSTSGEESKSDVDGKQSEQKSSSGTPSEEDSA